MAEDSEGNLERTLAVNHIVANHLITLNEIIITLCDLIDAQSTKKQMRVDAVKESALKELKSLRGR